MKNSIKQIRNNIGMTQDEVSKLIGIPVKSIRNWEQEIRKPSQWTIDLIIDRLLREKNEKVQTMDESTGILSFLSIKKAIYEVANRYNIDRIYLFGSYAKGEATGQSDIDLFMESELFGLDYFEFIEVLREHLGKKIELLSDQTIQKSSRIDQEIQNTGILIYER
jgi:predicted nucleotidyltransferase